MNLGIVDQAADALDAGARKALGDSVDLANQRIRELHTFSYLLPPGARRSGALISPDVVYGFTQLSGIAVKLEVAADLVRFAPGTGAGVVSDRAGKSREHPSSFRQPDGDDSHHAPRPGSDDADQRSGSRERP